MKNISDSKSDAYLYASPPRHT